jgi:hypothetical protein
MRFLLLLFILFSFKVTYAQQRLQVDSSVVVQRFFNENSIEQLKKEKDFQYENLREPVRSIWDRFWSWFWRKMSDILATRGGRIAFNTIFIVLAISVIAFFIWKVMGMNRNGVFGRNSKDGLDYGVSVDDINKISFAEAIEQAVTVGNFRLAVRLLYLQSLKRLADKGFIQWQVNKTNSDYLKEVSGRSWASLFTSLTYKFDYIWYGEMQVDKEQYADVQQAFMSFNNQL